MSATYYKHGYLVVVSLCCTLIIGCSSGDDTTAVPDPETQESANQMMDAVQNQFNALDATTSTISSGEIVLDTPNTDEFEQVPFTVNRIEIESAVDSSGTILLSSTQPFRVTVFIDDLIQLDNESNGVRSIFLLQNPEGSVSRSMQTAYHVIEGFGSTSFSVYCRASIDETQQLLPTCSDDFADNGIGYVSSADISEKNLSVLAIEFTYGPDFPVANPSIDRFGVYRTSIPIAITDPLLN